MAETLFQTRDGRAVTAVTAEEMRDVDRVAIEDVGLALSQMMENAGRNLAMSVRATSDPADPVVVLDRPGDQLQGAAAAQHATLDAMEVPVSVGPDGLPAAPAMVVDALVGYGLSGPLRGTAAEMVEHVPTDSTVVSLDVPTGRDATTGAEPGPAVDPARVVTWRCRRRGSPASTVRSSSPTSPSPPWSTTGLDLPTKASSRATIWWN
jgi:NAD(P)H-hydrate epimerase